MYNTYILSYSPFLSDPTPRRILEYVRSHAHTYQYLVPFAGSLVIKTQAPLGELVQSYRAFLSPNEFMLTQVNPSFVSGLLQTHYWDWLNAASPPALPNIGG